MKTVEELRKEGDMSPMELAIVAACQAWLSKSEFWVATDKLRIDVSRQRMIVAARDLGSWDYSPSMLNDGDILSVLLLDPAKANIPTVLTVNFAIWVGNAIEGYDSADPMEGAGKNVGVLGIALWFLLRRVGR